MARSRSPRPRTARRQTQTPAEVLADWSRGIVRDSPRTAIPEEGVYDSADFLLHQPGLAQKRGGSGYAGPALTGAAYGAAVKYAEFPSGAKLVAVGENGHLYTITPAATTDVNTMGAAYVPVDNPKLRVDKLVITASDGTSSPKKYDGSSVTALGGTPPAIKYAAVYKTRLVGTGVAANPNRVYFSPTPNIESTWDTANSWIDADYPLTGLAALQNVLLLFSQGHTERIVGSTPPPGSDMDRALVGDVGCTDARSIVTQENNCLFASPRGVYLTNGAGFASLTTEGAIESYWQSLFTGYNPATWVIAAGVYRSFYFVNILDNNGALVASLMCYVPRRAWWRVTNNRGVMFSTAVGVQEELYLADRATNRVQALSGYFSPSALNKNDADGTAVAPLLETRMLGRGTGLKHFGIARLSYFMEDAAVDDPKLAVSASTGIRAAAFASYRAMVLSDAPNGYWRLDDLTDTAAKAGVLTENAGPIPSSAGLIRNDQSVARDLNGSSHYYTAADSAYTDLADVFTLEAWLRVDALPGAGLVDRLFDKGTNAYALNITETGAFSLAKAGASVLVTSTAVMTVGQTYHVVATKNGATVKLYLNGVDVTGVVTNATMADTATALAIGRNATAASNYVDGVVDEPAVYPTELSAARVLAHYTLGATALATVAESPLAENTDVTRRPPLTIAKVAQGLTVRFQQANASARTELYALEVESRALPITMGGQ